MGNVGVYTIFRDPAGGSRDTAGMHQIPPGLNEPPRWTSYIAIESCEDVIERALELDGTVTVPPTTVPGIGRFAMLTDSQDAPFSVIEVGSASKKRAGTSGRRRRPSGRVSKP
jgi:predicted enzyme related to lactoylglutathione lyase